MMSKTLAAFALLIAVRGDCEQAYDEFLKRFPSKKNSYQRMSIFCANWDNILEQNQANRGFALGVNEFTDWTHEEFKSLLGGGALNYSSPEIQASLYKPSANSSVSSVDWRAHMPIIKNQRHCGSCWAFAAIDVVDFHTGSPHSEQQLVDCSGQGCSGGSPYHALSYLASVGSDAESAYAYRGNEGSCRQSGVTPTAAISNVQAVHGESDIAAAASEQVVAFCIYGGDSFDFQHYSSGVFDGDCGSTSHGHCLGIVGYTPDYWIIRNSWGTSWGQSGYMYFKRGSNLCTIGTRGAAIAAATARPDRQRNGNESELELVV